MAENENIAVEEEVSGEVFADEAMSDAESAMWDNDDVGCELNNEPNDSAEQEADQPNEAEETPTESEQQTADDADQYLELKHFEEIEKVDLRTAEGKQRVKQLAQMGKDYGRVRGKLEEANAALAKAKVYEDFLNEMKGDFDTIDDLIHDMRARNLSESEGISYEEAAGRVKEAAQPQQETKPVMDVEAIREASLDQFLVEYPDVKAADIPQEVWEDMKTTNNLSLSYAKWQYRQLSAEAETLRQNQKNKSRSTGSMTSTGAAKKRDWEDDLWYNDY